MLISSIGALPFCMDGVDGIESSWLYMCDMHISSVYIAQLKAAAIYVTPP